ncbi:Uncharacterised protein [Mycobacterium tuberculosis]|nr:Uncharacterised protein [Mycobacterium tuberculosis]COV58142.1 Uncharacterised protein [Mycobacterium tuberculosis]
MTIVEPAADAASLNSRSQPLAAPRGAHVDRH